MADDADAAERTMNGSIDVLTQPVEQTNTEIGEPAERATGRGTDAHSAGAIGDADNERAGADVRSGMTNSDEPEERITIPGSRLALVVGLVAVLALAAVGGWFGYGMYRAHQTDMQRSRFLSAAKQGALNLTTINYTQADADVQRILDSATGQFYDDFAKRAPAFIDLVKQRQAKTHGNITEAGVESTSGDSARVLVAVAVDTTSLDATDQSPRHWRMRIDLQKVGDTVKLSNVGFVP
jgi:Mce-associated membrane protein